MFEKLKHRSILKKTKRNLENRDLSGLNNKLKTIGFLVDESQFQDFDKLYAFYKPFGLQPKDVKVFSFIRFKKSLPTLRQNQLHHKEINWKGHITNSNATEFLDSEFTVLVALYNGRNTFLDLMVSESKAHFKVGFHKSDPKLYDLLLGIDPNDVELLEKELLKYTKVLNKLESK